jgi:hypothetical protein
MIEVSDSEYIFTESDTGWREKGGEGAGEREKDK